MQEFYSTCIIMFSYINYILLFIIILFINIVLKYIDLIVKLLCSNIKDFFGTNELFNHNLSL